METRIITEQKVRDQLQIISYWTKNLIPKVEFVTGLPRGGVIPAVLFSHEYGLKYIESGELVRNSFFIDSEENQRKVLILDDMADSGKTIKDYIKNTEFRVATLFVRNTTEVWPHYFGSSIVDNDWLRFPWERKDSDRQRDYVKNQKQETKTYE